METEAAPAGRPKARASLYALLLLLLVVALGAFATEYAFVASGARAPSHDALLATADAVDDDDTAVSGADYYPEDIFATDWAQRIDARDILHVNALHRACVSHKKSVISWQFADPEASEDVIPEQTLVNRSDPELLDKIRQCSDVDVYLPEGLRSYGYCEDAVAYTKCAWDLLRIVGKVGKADGKIFCYGDDSPAVAHVAAVGDGARVPRRSAQQDGDLPRPVPQHAHAVFQPLLGQDPRLALVAQEQAALPHAQH